MVCDTSADARHESPPARGWEADWHPNDGIQKLINQINAGREYAHFANQPINDPEAVDIALRVIPSVAYFQLNMPNGLPSIIIHGSTSRTSGKKSASSRKRLYEQATLAMACPQSKMMHLMMQCANMKRV